jgi:hypothetical protein
MAIEKLKSGGFAITGKEDTAKFRLVSMASALRLKIKTGMEMSRGPSVATIIKKEFGLKGNNRKVYDQFCEMHGITNKFHEEENKIHFTTH